MLLNVLPEFVRVAGLEIVILCTNEVGELRRDVDAMIVEACQNLEM